MEASDMVGRYVRVAAAVIVFALLVPAAAHADDAALKARAATFISGLADEAISQLTDPGLSTDEQEARFRKIIHKDIAFQSIARWVLGGRYWRRASAEQRKRYLTLFEDLMVATYAHRFQNYSGEKLKVVATRVIDPQQALVRSTLMRPNAEQPLHIDWRVRETDGRFRIIDIMVEGLSMAQTQRSEFASVLRDNGGDLNALLNNLEKRLTDARAARKTDAKESARKS